MPLPSEVATEIVQGERRRTYGHPYVNYKRAVGAFNELTGHDLRVEEGPLFMLCLKLAREASAGYPADYPDNLDDTAGYANVLAMVKEAIGGLETTAG